MRTFYHYATNNAIDNANAIRVMLREGEIELHCSAGDYDFQSQQTIFGPRVWVRCAGVGRTHWYCNAKGGMCSWEANHMTRIEHLSMQSVYGPGVQSQVFGFQRANAPDSPIVFVDDVEMTGGAFACYSWTARRAKWYINMLQAKCGGWAVTAGGSSGPDAQYMFINNSLLIVDRNLYQSADASQGLQSAGIAVRGGDVKAYNNVIRVIGSSGFPNPGYPNFPMCAAIGVLNTSAPNDPAQHPYSWPTTKIVDTEIDIIPNGSQHFAETERQIGTLTRL